MSADFSRALKDRIAALAARYPSRPAALLPVLHAVQGEIGFVPPDAEREIAALLGIQPIQVREAATFYTMIRRKPPGRYHIRVCDNLSCGLRGSAAILDRLRTRLGLAPGRTTADGKFSLDTVACVGACEIAPCLMINFEYYGGLDPEGLDRLLDGLD